MKNLLFIPCYNCAPQIQRVLKKIDHRLDFFNEIIIIDNISTDDTFERAKNIIESHPLAAKLKLVKNPANIGLGGTHKLAFSYAIENKYHHVAILHGDDQGDIYDFSIVFSEMSKNELDSFMFGARFDLSSTLEHYSKIKTFGNKIFNFIATKLTGVTIYDLGGSGLNVFPVKLIENHPYNSYSNDLTFHVYVLLNALRLKQTVTFIPISWREFDQVSNVKIVRQALKLFSILIKYKNETSVTVANGPNSFTHSHQSWIT